MRIHLVTGLALLLASCGKPAVDQSRHRSRQAARICYAAVLQQAMPPEQRRETLSAAALLGPLFPRHHRGSGGQERPGDLADVSDFGSDAQVGKGLSRARAHRQPARLLAALSAGPPGEAGDAVRPCGTRATCLYVARLAPELVARHRAARPTPARPPRGKSMRASAMTAAPPCKSRSGNKLTSGATP